jgi:hypothetical protein
VSPAETAAQVGVTGGSGGSGALFTKQDPHPFSPSSGFASLGGILIAAPAVASVPDPNTHVWQLSFSPQNLTGRMDQGGSIQFGAGAAALLYRPDNP